MYHKSLFLISLLIFSAACKPRESADATDSKKQSSVQDFASLLKEDAIQYKKAQNGAPVEPAGSLNLVVDSQADVLANSSAQAINDSLDKNKDGQALNVAGDYLLDEYEKALTEAKMQEILDGNTLSLANGKSDADLYTEMGGAFLLLVGGAAFSIAVVEYINPSQGVRLLSEELKTNLVNELKKVQSASDQKAFSSKLKAAGGRIAANTKPVDVFKTNLAINSGLPEGAARENFITSMTPVDAQLERIIRGNFDPTDVEAVKNRAKSLAPGNANLLLELDRVVAVKTDWTRLNSDARASMLNQIGDPTIQDAARKYGNIKNQLQSKVRERVKYLGGGGVLAAVGLVLIAIPGGVVNLAGGNPYVECASISSEAERLQCWKVNRVRRMVKMGELYNQYNASF